MSKKKIIVIGAGVVGSTTAWYLASLGHNVAIIDQNLNKPIDYTSNLSGTDASLGVLMGYVCKRSSGRNWQLRKRSMELWPVWVKELTSNQSPLTINTPFIQLANSEKEYQSMIKLAIKRKNLGLEVFKKDSISHIVSRSWPKSDYGGVISHKDGRIIPRKLMASLMLKLTELNVEIINAKVQLIEKNNLTRKTWFVFLEKQNRLHADVVVICTANGTEPLLTSLGYHRPIEPVLGQVLTLHSIEDGKSWKGWPAILSSGKYNLIPYKSNKFLLGATVETGIKASKEALQEMHYMNSNYPSWIRNCSVDNHWQGLRARPIDRPSPILENLEDGLILNTAHYRNGFLLAPACAEWVKNEILKLL